VSDSDTPLPALITGQLLIYRDGALNLQVRLDGQTVWLTQRQLADLYQTSVPNISQHLTAIYGEGELAAEATVKRHLIVQTEGARQVSRTVEHYSLDVILAVGYRVRSPRGTLFRQWATQRLGELLAKGFTMDDERIEAGRTLGADYFDELLARIRDIRASERLLYQKITDIYATSIDCGGVFGYYRAIEALQNPSEDNAEWREWIGDAGNRSPPARRGRVVASPDLLSRSS